MGMGEALFLPKRMSPSTLRYSEIIPGTQTNRMHGRPGWDPAHTMASSVQNLGFYFYFPMDLQF